tara:strand:- start:168 stop:806 length:639 start_codon:yes stop_codon:yes gene_type:complete
MQIENKLFYVFGKGKLSKDFIDFLLKNIDKKNIIVVPELPEPSWTDSLVEYCNELDIKVSSYSDVTIRTYESIGISIYFSKIFKKEFIDQFEYFVNLHNGPLPRYRGVNPINWALKNKETKHGVTLHTIESGIDTGKILDQIMFPINDDMEVIDVYNLCLSNGIKILERSIFNLDNIEPIKQDDSFSTYYSKKDFEKLGDRKYFTRDTLEET